MVVQLIYRNKNKPPYITRATFKKPPGTIIHDNAVFQNRNIVYANNNKHNIIYQYREVPSVLINEIALLTPLPIKFKPVSDCD